MAEQQSGDGEQEIVAGVLFAPGQPIQYFRRGRLNVVPGDMVVARLERGIDLGRVTKLTSVSAEEAASMRPLLRRATDRDLRRREALNRRREEALARCKEKVAEHGLPMRLIDCYYTLDGRRIVFYFAAEGRVDFRALVRDLARIFKCRVELRQVGVRDHAKLLGGIGPCGRPLCCAEFLHSFDPVSIRMAKEQGLALNPSKLSGLCDRLMCCLLFEREIYLELSKNLPEVGEVVATPRGEGKVESVNVISQQVTVKFDDGAVAVFSADELKAAAEEQTEQRQEQEGEAPAPAEIQPDAEQPAQSEPQPAADETEAKTVSAQPEEGESAASKLSRRRSRRRASTRRKRSRRFGRRR